MYAKQFTTALLLGCLLSAAPAPAPALAPALALALAQEADDARPTAARTKAPPALPPDADITSPDRQPGRQERVPALLQMQGQVLRLEGAVPGEKVAILAGLPGTPVTLPGGDQLCFLPLAVLAAGEVADDGEFSVELKYEGPRVAPFTFLVQAVSLDKDGVLRVSCLFEMHFDGVGKFHGWAIVVQTGNRSRARGEAIRPDMLA